MQIFVKSLPRFGINYYTSACPISKALLRFAQRKLFKPEEFEILKQAGIDVIIVG